MTDVIATTCPECGGWLDFDHLALGVSVDCPDCGANLEVMEIEPLTLVMVGDPDEVAYPEDDERRAV